MGPLDQSGSESADSPDANIGCRRNCYTAPGPSNIMPIARYWVVKTGGNEVTEDMVNVWKENFLDYAMENGCLRGALVADEERIIAVSMWPDMATLEAVVEGDHYSVIGEAVGASWGAGGIDLSEDIEFVCNGDVLAMMVPGGM